MHFAAQRPQASAAHASASSSQSALDNLLGLSSALEAPAPAPVRPPALSLDPQPSLTPSLFQGKWAALQPAQRFTVPLPPSALANIEADNHQVLLWSEHHSQACPQWMKDYFKEVARAAATCLATMQDSGPIPSMYAPVLCDVLAVSCMIFAGLLAIGIQHGHRHHGIWRQGSCVQILHVCQATDQGRISAGGDNSGQERRQCDSDHKVRGRFVCASIC